MTEPVSTMSSRRDKDKGSGNTGKNAKQDKSSSREDRLTRRSTTSSGDGLDGAVTAAAAVTSKERQTRHSTSLSPPTGKDSSKAKITRSATNSPVVQRTETHKRTRQAESSESSDDECSEAGASDANLADAGAKLKKRCNIQV